MMLSVFAIIMAVGTVFTVGFVAILDHELDKAEQWDREH